RDEERNLGAPENYRVAPSGAEFLDDTAKVPPRFVFEAAVHQLIEDDRIDPLAIRGTGDLVGYTSDGELRRIDRALHEVAGPENPKPLEPSRGSEVRNLLGNVEPGRRRLVAHEVQGLVDGIVGADQHLRPGLHQLARRREQQPRRFVPAL